MARLLFFLILSFSSALAIAQPNNFGLGIIEGKNSAKDIVGKAFPKFSATTLDGKKVNEQTLQGKITLINMWFRDCPPCRAEFSALNKLYNKYKDNPNVEIISFTIDPKKSAKETMQEYEISYMVCCVSSEKCSRLRFRQGGFPANIIVDKTGRVTHFETGGQVVVSKAEQHFENVIEKKIEELLAE